ncbi:hypothetical protein LINPERHAP1_LOCUS38738 [Linum perenne]
MAETFNGWILDARSKVVITMLEDIRKAVMQRIQSKRDNVGSWITDIAPRAMEKLEREKKLARNCRVIWNGDKGSEVADGEDSHTTNTSSRTCTCRGWDLTGIPCRHDIAAIISLKERPEDYIDTIYRMENYLQAYQFVLQPVPRKNLYPHVEGPEIMPPVIVRMPGRQKKARRNDLDEPKKTNTSVSGVRYEVFSRQ